MDGQTPPRFAVELVDALEGYDVGDDDLALAWDVLRDAPQLDAEGQRVVLRLLLAVIAHEREGSTRLRLPGPSEEHAEALTRLGISAATLRRLRSLRAAERLYSAVVLGMITTSAPVSLSRCWMRQRVANRSLIKSWCGEKVS